MTYLNGYINLFNGVPEIDRLCISAACQLDPNDDSGFLNQPVLIQTDNDQSLYHNICTAHRRDNSWLFTGVDLCNHCIQKNQQRAA